MTVGARQLFSEDDIAEAVARMGREIAANHADEPVLVAVLKGSVIFLADLIRAIDARVAVDFIAISHYAPDSGRVRIVKDLEVDILGRDVILVEDVVDTGLTVTFLVRQLLERGAASVHVAALLDRRSKRIVPLEVTYRGFEIEDEFVLGYGLDWDERYRNVRRIVAGDLRELQADPEIYVPELYEVSRPGAERGDEGPVVG